jgi:hypothetical protein
MEFGGFLIFFTPQLKIFIDDRCELYKDDFLLKFFNATEKDINIWSDMYGFDIALIGTNSKLYKIFKKSPNWQCLKETPAGTIFSKISTKNEYKCNYILIKREHP